MKFTTTTSLMAGLLAPAALAQQLCGVDSNTANAGYEFNNNMWGKDDGNGSQCLDVISSGSDGVSWQAKWTWSGSPELVKSYPYSGRTIDEKKLISDISSIPAKAEWEYTGNDGFRADVAYDCFSSANPDASTDSGDYELMVWLAVYGDKLPIGSSVGTVNIDGHDWDLFDGYNGDMRVFSFFSSSPINSLDTDIKKFYNHLEENNGFPSSSQYLTTTQFGTETFTGSATFKVSHWSTEIN